MSSIQVPALIQIAMQMLLLHSLSHKSKRMVDLIHRSLPEALTIVAALQSRGRMVH